MTTDERPTCLNTGAEAVWLSSLSNSAKVMTSWHWCWAQTPAPATETFWQGLKLQPVHCPTWAEQFCELRGREMSVAGSSGACLDTPQDRRHAAYRISSPALPPVPGLATTQLGLKTCWKSAEPSTPETTGLASKCTIEAE